jgi:choline dehydrogenase
VSGTVAAAMSDGSGFDYVIVGAGSAGCVLAARLTEDPDIRVLLVEAGPRDASWRIAMPAAVGSLLSSDRFNWNYVSDPEPYLDGRRLTHPRGRVLGGSSSINGMVYIRGHAGDYDGWARADLPGWAYADVLPYFKKSERHLHGGDAYHGASGPLSVFAPDLSRTPLAAAFVEAAAQAGYGLAADPNGERQESFGRVDRTTTARGRRCSTAYAYLRPALARANLRVLTGALVHRILLQGDRASRHRILGERPSRAGLRRRRGAAVRGRHQLTAAAAAVGDRPGRRVVSSGHRAATRVGCRGREPQRSS